ncbi:acyltransferase [Patescibacteria group bacterium]
MGRNSIIHPLGIKKATNSKIKIGDSSIILGRLVTEKSGAVIRIKDRVFIGKSTIDASENITIEEDVLISSNCFIADSDGHSLNYRIRKNDVINRLKGFKDWGGVRCKPIKICKNSWVGYGSIILKGVTLGEGSVVGAGSVVKTSVPPFTIVAGNPAKIVKRIKH